MTRAILSQTREQGTGYVPIGGAVMAARHESVRALPFDCALPWTNAAK